MKAVALGLVIGGVTWVLVSLVWDLVREWVDIVRQSRDWEDLAEEMAAAYNAALHERTHWQDQAAGWRYEAERLEAHVRVLRAKLDQAERLLEVVDPEVRRG